MTNKLNPFHVVAIIFILLFLSGSAEDKIKCLGKIRKAKQTISKAIFLLYCLLCCNAVFRSSLLFKFKEPVVLL